VKVNVLSSGGVRGLGLRWGLVVALATAGWMTSVVVASAAPGQAAAASKTTKARVYTAAQATRGEELYMSLCVSCHPPATYTGAVFKAWQGRNLGELLAFLQEKMPKNDPGSLTDKEYADVIAYLLKLNKMPTGRAELLPDLKILRTINIDILP
jgi:mono/diheme cytochrome c family protein